MANRDRESAEGSARLRYTADACHRAEGAEGPEAEWPGDGSAVP